VIRDSGDGEGPKIAFEPKLFCDAYGGQLYLEATHHQAIRQLLPNCPHALPPHCLLLRSESGEAKVVAPLGVLKRRQSYPEPFSTKVSLRIFDEEFLCPTAAYDLPLATGTDLKCPSLLSALWLLLSRLLQLDYEGAVKLLPFVSVASAEGHLRHDEALVFRMALRDTSDRNPDAVAIRLRLVHASVASVQPDGDLARSAFADAASYISHLTHVSQSCCMSLDEELELWNSLSSMKSEMEATNRYIAWRRSVLLAWKQGTSEVDLQWARHCPGAWLSGVLDDEEQAAYLQNLPVTEIDCIGIKGQPLLECSKFRSTDWPELLEMLEGVALKDGLFATLLGLWEMGKSVEVQRLATRMLLFSVARGQSLDRRLLLTLFILQISFPKGPNPSMKSPRLVAFQNLLPRQSKERKEWVNALFDWGCRHLRENPGLVDEMQSWKKIAPLDGSVSVPLSDLQPTAVPRSATDFRCHRRVLAETTGKSSAWPVLSDRELQEMSVRTPALLVGCESLRPTLTKEPLPGSPWRLGLLPSWKDSLQRLVGNLNCKVFIGICLHRTAFVIQT